MSIQQPQPLRIGIIGAGFSGTAMAAALSRLAHLPIEITVCEKTGYFGAGDAYSTPFPFHLLNARARDMSALEDQPDHFVTWLNSSQTAHPHLEKAVPVGEQFVSRFLYGNYLNDLLEKIKTNASSPVKLQLQAGEVVDVIPGPHQTTLVLQNQQQIHVDKVILALGNGSPTDFPFPISPDVNCIVNPWDYNLPKQIPSEDPVLIVGTGLSMIDAVLTLYHQQHQGKIYAVSRHGLLPLPHADIKVPFFSLREHIPTCLRSLTKYLRSKSASHIQEGGDWRSVINALRADLPSLWSEATLIDKKRFLRHLLPYWNIHRHRVHAKVAELLADLSAQQQLQIWAGRIAGIEDGQAKIKLRHRQDFTQVKVKWAINCMGPALNVNAQQQRLLHALVQRNIACFDELNLGFAVTAIGELKNKMASTFYALGSFRKGASWEAVAVPEIRKQCFDLAKHVLSEV